jgi:ATP phosphoribosyltransferase regulatory subunit
VRWALESSGPVTEPRTAGSIPPGTRDVLPDEMRELRQIQDAILGEFERAGYSEVRTPTIEYADLLARGGRRGGPLYRFLDDRGELVALRNDMTVPIARLAAARLGETSPPWRLSYLGQSFRTTSARRADLRESGQAGIELIGPGGAEGTLEVLSVLDRCLAEVGLDGVVVSLGDARLWPALLDRAGLEAKERDACLEALATGDLVGLERSLNGRSTGLEEVARTRGGADVLDVLEQAGDGGSGTAERLRSLWEGLDGDAMGFRVLFDLGMARDPEYYSGEVFEVYIEGLGRSIGGGGRYDGLMEQSGISMPAAGFSINLERVHEALIERGSVR